jgi:hypothetical protein
MVDRACSPWRPVARPVPPLVQLSGDGLERQAVRSKGSHGDEQIALARLWFKGLTVKSDAEPKGQIACSTSLRLLVPQGVSRALADGLALPLANTCHDVQHQSASSRAGVESLTNAHKRNATASEPVEQFGEIANASRESIQLGDNHYLHSARINKLQRPLKTGPLKRLRRLASVRDDLCERSVLHFSHRAQLGSLCFEADSLPCLLLGAHSHVSDCRQHFDAPFSGYRAVGRQAEA